MQKHRVLIVEDEQDIAGLIKHTLERGGGAEAEIVGSGDAALKAVTARPPDLIILDEFQRFKHLLDGTDKASGLASELFDYEGARVLLLSATPYKMYTLSHEAELSSDDHYKDFVKTFKFLSSDPNGSNEFVNLLQNYRRALFRLGSGEELLKLKLELETKLRGVMVSHHGAAVFRARPPKARSIVRGSSCFGRPPT